MTLDALPEKQYNDKLNEVISKLDKDVIPAISELRTSVQVLSVKFTSKCDDIDKVIVDVGGNGKAGLKVDVEVIKRWIDSQTWWQRLIVGAIVANIIGLIFLYAK